ncbi:hypothetical protein HZI30_13370 [Serratia fonticola]|uniref:hypothetical protein n=1 Tax=Serratia fonticola TaxID=47917 RepID=UPI0015C60783|nr:hypothetical protein [Serratia fonticola]NXZ87923.1 hypothetical protein [Serratia fonticola]
MKYQALSILKPAVDNILNGSKKLEIRSWTPPYMPLNNVVLVQNEKYLVNQDDEDDGFAMAIVDFTSIFPWTEADYLRQKNTTTMWKEWKLGYFCWTIENVRVIKKPMPCKAMKGIYTLEFDGVL